MSDPAGQSRRERAIAVAERHRAAGRTPDDVEQEALLGLVAAYIMRDARGTADDRHEQRHLRAGLEVSSNGHCRPGFCPLVLTIENEGASRRIKIQFDVPYDTRASDG